MVYRVEWVRCFCVQSLFVKIFVCIRFNKDCIELNKKERGYDVYNLYMQNLGFKKIYFYFVVKLKLQYICIYRNQLCKN